jgi:hypothetical protein
VVVAMVVAAAARQVVAMQEEEVLVEEEAVQQVLAVLVPAAVVAREAAQHAQGFHTCTLKLPKAQTRQLDVFELADPSPWLDSCCPGQDRSSLEGNKLRSIISEASAWSTTTSQWLVSLYIKRAKVALAAKFRRE